MIRRAAEYGLSSLFADWMLKGGAEVVFERIERSGFLKPEELERLKADTRAHLQAVRDEGKVQADVLVGALRAAVAAAPVVTELARTAGEALAQRAAQAMAARTETHASATDAPAAAGEAPTGDAP